MTHTKCVLYVLFMKRLLFFVETGMLIGFHCMNYFFVSFSREHLSVPAKLQEFIQGRNLPDRSFLDSGCALPSTKGVVYGAQLVTVL